MELRTMGGALWQPEQKILRATSEAESLARDLAAGAATRRGLGAGSVLNHSPIIQCAAARPDSTAQIVTAISRIAENPYRRMRRATATDVPLARKRLRSVRRPRAPLALQDCQRATVVP
jgi:hypothetical protein